jgi:hypothetical protein
VESEGVSSFGNISYFDLDISGKGIAVLSWIYDVRHKVSDEKISARHFAGTPTGSFSTNETAILQGPNRPTERAKPPEATHESLQL